MISCPLAGPLPGTLSFLLCNWDGEMGPGAFFIRESMPLWEARGKGGRPGQSSSDQLGSGSVKNVSCLSYSLPPPDLGAVRSGCGSRGGTWSSQVGSKPEGPEGWSGSLLQDLGLVSTHRQECTCLLALDDIIGP